MIVQCEKCRTKFRIADDRVSSRGVKVRCSRCAHVFVARRDEPKFTEAGAETTKLRPSELMDLAAQTNPERSDSSGPTMAPGFSGIAPATTEQAALALGFAGPQSEAPGSEAQTVQAKVPGLDIAGSEPDPLEAPSWATDETVARTVDPEPSRPSSPQPPPPLPPPPTATAGPKTTPPPPPPPSSDELEVPNFFSSPPTSDPFAASAPAPATSHGLPTLGAGSPFGAPSQPPAPESGQSIFDGKTPFAAVDESGAFLHEANPFAEPSSAPHPGPPPVPSAVPSEVGLDANPFAEPSSAPRPGPPPMPAAPEIGFDANPFAEPSVSRSGPVPVPSAVPSSNPFAEPSSAPRPAAPGMPRPGSNPFAEPSSAPKPTPISQPPSPVSSPFASPVELGGNSADIPGLIPPEALSSPDPFGGDDAPPPTPEPLGSPMALSPEADAAASPIARIDLGKAAVPNLSEKWSQAETTAIAAAYEDQAPTPPPLRQELPQVGDRTGLWPSLVGAVLGAALVLTFLPEVGAGILDTFSRKGADALNRVSHTRVLPESLEDLRPISTHVVTYPIASGERVLVVRGGARNLGANAASAISAVALAMDGDTVVARASAPVGILLDPGVLARLESPSQVTAAYAQRSGGAGEVRIDPGGELPFMVVFPEMPGQAEARDFLVEFVPFDP